MNNIATLTNITRETNDTQSFILKINNPVILNNYQVGQYIILSAKENRIERRSYSIVEILDYKKGIIKLTVKRIPNGYFSRLLHEHATIGSSFYVEGISGFFTLPESIKEYKSVHFYAAGSGITAIFALIKHILCNYPDISIFLTYSNKSPEQTIFYKEIEQLKSKHTNQLYVTYFFSNSGSILNARINNTNLTRLLSEKNIKDYNHHLFYICGPLEYMDTVSIALLTEGVPKTNIKKEIFNTLEIETTEQPPDINPRKVKVRIDENTIKEFTVAYPNSILDVIQEQGLIVPYSCRSGQCGSCAARIIKGEVWMSYNEVLTDKEIQQGLTLTCCGFPINGDVEISYY